MACLLFIYFYFSLTSNIPFQLSPVAILNKVNMAVPKSLKCACGPSPWQGWDGEHSVKHDKIDSKIVHCVPIKSGYSNIEERKL